MTRKLVTSADSVVDSLERLASELEKGKIEDPMDLKGALGWGWHAVALLSYMRLQPRREQVDAWLWDYLDEGNPDFEIERDAHWEERQRLSLLEILDIFSQVELPLLKPEFYQGWTDRTVRCQTLRRQVGDIVGSSIGAEQRAALLALLAHGRACARSDCDRVRLCGSAPDRGPVRVRDRGRDVALQAIRQRAPRAARCAENARRCP